MCPPRPQSHFPLNPVGLPPTHTCTHARPIMVVVVGVGMEGFHWHLRLCYKLAPSHHPNPLIVGPQTLMDLKALMFGFSLHRWVTIVCLIEGVMCSMGLMDYNWAGKNWRFAPKLGENYFHWIIMKILFVCMRVCSHPTLTRISFVGSRLTMEIWHSFDFI